MTSILAGFDAALAALRIGFLAAAGVLAVIAATDWMVRTRRINPFGRVAKFMRHSVEPLMAPVERQIVRAGGLPSNAPWWSLAAAVLGGIIVLSVLGFLRGQVYSAMFAAQGGTRSVLRLLIQWTFMLLRVALIVRVVSAWIRVSPYSRWVRWSFTLSEPILRPLRQIVPAIGMIDITPIVAYFVLSLLEALLVGLT